MAEILGCDTSYQTDTQTWLCPECGRSYPTYKAGTQALCVKADTPEGEALAASQSDDQAEEGQGGIGTLERAPDGQSVRVTLTPEEVAKLSNLVIDALRAAKLPPTTQLWISLLMLAGAHLRALGVSPSEAMQLLTVGWNGEETGILKIKARTGRDGG